jgi:hypothetical protein
LPGHDLIPEIMNRLDLWDQARTTTEEALAAMITEHHDIDSVVEALLSRLQFAGGGCEWTFAAPIAGRSREVRNIVGTATSMVERARGTSSPPAQSGNSLFIPRFMTILRQLRA